MEPYFYCTYGGIRPICSDCKRNHINSPYKTSDITTWLSPSYIKIDGTTCSDYIPIKEPTMVDKQEFIDKACEILNSMLCMRDCIYYKCVSSSHHATIEDFINEFKKLMEE